MKQEINIYDESGDRKYFTQIPNMIVNHSTAYEQSLYLIMKRLAGEHGSCFASLNWLSKKMGAHRISVTKTIKKLIERKWIKEIEPMKVKGGKVRQFTIIDLWALNIKEYESASQMPTFQSASNIPRSASQITESASQIDTKKSYSKSYTKKNSSFKKPYYYKEEMRKSQGKWWVLPTDGGDWLEFAGSEKDITWI